MSPSPPPRVRFKKGRGTVDYKNVAVQKYIMTQTKVAQDQAAKHRARMRRSAGWVLIGYLDGLVDSLVSVFRTASASVPRRAPKTAERLLLLIYPRDRLDEVEGDMQEIFARLCVRQGVGFARVWYWWQVVCAVGVRGWAFVERVAKLFGRGGASD